MQPTTGEQWAFCSSMMLLTSRRSTVCILQLHSILQYSWFPQLIMLLFLTDIRNWIRNIEQHASDNVNKILIGNKADMDESKRVFLFIFIVSHISCPSYSAFLLEIFCSLMSSLR